MAKSIEYSQEKSLDDELENVLSNNVKFLKLREDVKIVACFVIRSDENSQTVPGKGEPVALKKVSPEMRAFMRTKAHFVMVVDYHFWEHALESEKIGNMTRALTRIVVEKTDAGLKIGTKKWDIQDNIETIESCGLYNEPMQRLNEAIKRSKLLLSVAQSSIDRMSAGAPSPEVEPSPVQASPHDPIETEEPPVEGEKPPKPLPRKTRTEQTRPPRRPPVEPDPVLQAEEPPEPED